jgi:hypothetical protein
VNAERGACRKILIPSTKSQTNPNDQLQERKTGRFWFWLLESCIWKLFGIWCLVIEISRVPSARITALVLVIGILGLGIVCDLVLGI